MMKETPMRSFFRLSLALSLVALVTGCLGSGGDDNETARIRLLNVSTGYASLDLYTNNDDDDDDNDELRLSNVTRGSLSDYADLDSNTYSFKFKSAGVTATLRTVGGVELTDDSNATFIAYGSVGNFVVTSVTDDESDADSGDTKIRVINVSEAGAVDIFLTDEDVELDDAEPVISALAGGGQTGTTVDAGTYRLRVTGAGDTDDLRFDLSGLALESTDVVSIILTATEGGALVNALVLPQQGELTTYPNTKARIRGAQGLASGTATLSVGGVRLLNNNVIGVIGSTYQQVEAGTVEVALGVNGTAVPAGSRTLTAGADYTLLVWTDSNGATQTSIIADDNRLPDSASDVKMRVLNGMSGLGNPVTLAVNFDTVADSVVLNTASSYEEISSGSAIQLDVYDSLLSTQLYNRNDVTLTANTVYTLFMAGSSANAVGTLRKDR
jgi:hypothetical protein